MPFRSPASRRVSQPSPVDPATDPQLDPLLLAFSPKPPTPRPSIIVRFLSAIARTAATAVIFLPQAYLRRRDRRRIAWEDARENWILTQQRETIERMKVEKERECEELRQQLMLAQEALSFQTDVNEMNRSQIAAYIAMFGRKTEEELVKKMMLRPGQSAGSAGGGIEGLFQ